MWSPRKAQPRIGSCGRHRRAGRRPPSAVMTARSTRSSEWLLQSRSSTPRSKARESWAPSTGARSSASCAALSRRSDPWTVACCCACDSAISSCSHSDRPSGRSLKKACAVRIPSSTASSCEGPVGRSRFRKRRVRHARSPPRSPGSSRASRRPRGGRGGIGAILLLLIYRLIVGRRTRGTTRTDATSRRATASAAERWPFVLAVGPPDLEDHAVARRPEKDRGRRAPRAAAGAWPTR
jgi:hypothetical protein